ncbi:MAG: hypothetical protein N2257_00505 [Thermodesulfovibrionales bacterium]|nr:hypothetical protein [Thermodesulfovibrionales bacterium]
MIRDVMSGTVHGQNMPGRQLSKNEFLRLFITQLRFQDPLNPLDSTGMTAQLAQFSALEELQNLRSQMNDLLLYQNSLQNTMAISLIGKRVRTGDEPLYKTVTGITFEDNTTYLLLDSGEKVQLGDIKEIGGVL